MTLEKHLEELRKEREEELQKLNGLRKPLELPTPQPDWPTLVKIYDQNWLELLDLYPPATKEFNQYMIDALRQGFITRFEQTRFRILEAQGLLTSPFPQSPARILALKQKEKE